MFVKLETDAGVIGWGEGTLEGKAGAVMACIDDFRDFLIGADPMQVEHHWQSMYVHSFYRAGTGDGLGDLRHRPGAVGPPRQAARIAGIQVAGRAPRHRRRARLLPCRRPNREELARLRETAIRTRGYLLQERPWRLFEWIETHAKIKRVVQDIEMLREGLGPDIDIAIDFHAKTSPSVASILIKETRAAEPAVY